MEMNTWAPLWNTIVDSSVWDEPDHVRVLFVTMMALKDSDHVVRCTAYQLGKRARKSEVEVLEALRILSEPDTKRIEPQPFEGRRIKAVEDGWLVLNGEKYREKVQVEMRKARQRRGQAAFRQRQKEKAIRNGKPLPGESAAVARRDAGDDAAADAITSQALPDADRVPGD